MPLPISFTLLLAAIAFSNLASPVAHVLLYVCIGLAVVNELLRFIALRVTPAAPSEYQIPARTPAPPSE